ncbi:MFS general substrate transporter [Sistotremastrum suecicum HHB10207 ss-3]|uniref:MFS general substrate transporter n=1 Tax=Sistotremastrum suecicum HHB10207 ss-3 TaxID=1314776 RepID=A0A166F0X4_9AGAM|nr:MFS general substrate transporter [Sistotremastrum suecicum HHB10207 ss-3]
MSSPMEKTLSDNSPSFVSTIVEAAPQKDEEKVVEVCEEEPLPPPLEFPDGGWEAWMTVFGSATLLFGTFGVVSSYGVFQAYYEETFSVGTSNSLISFTGSLQFFIQQFGGLLVGPIWDTTGVKYLLPVSAACTALSLFTLSVCQPGKEHFWQVVLAQGVLMGTATAMTFSIALAVCSHWFAKHRGTAMGMVVSGSSLGGIVVPLIFENLVHKIGFGWTVRTIGFISMFCYAIAFFTIRTRLPFGKRRSLRKSIDWVAFKDPTFTLLSFCFPFVLAGFSIPYYFIQIFAGHYHVKSTITDNLVTIMNASAFVGRILAGIVGDRVGKFNATIPITFLCCLLCYLNWLLGASNGPALVVFAVLYGAASGSLISLGPASVAEISPRDKVGARIGTNLACVSVGSVLGPVIAGAIAQEVKPKTIRGVILFAGSLFAVATVFSIAARLSVSRKLRTKV